MAGGGFDAPESGSSSLHKQKKYKKGKKLGVRIDMTPMVDVIMLLLTFFILTTTLNTPQILQINLPKGDEKDKQDISNDRILYIYVSEAGNIYFAKGKADGTNDALEKVAFNNVNNKIKENLASIKAIYPNPEDNPYIIMKFDRKMKYSLMVDFIDEVNKLPKEDRTYGLRKLEDADKELVKNAGG